MSITSLINSTRPVIMGILNVTPDSFSDGGDFFGPDSAVAHALQMQEEGADIIDIGGESSRPGSDPVSAEEELRRVIPAIEGIRKQSDVPISVDTTKSTVAAQAVQAGANMVNDISAGRIDPKMLQAVASMNVPICLMHMRGTPKTMQVGPHYDDLIGEIRTCLSDSVAKAKEAGINDIILDPGIGFGKTPDGNVEILKKLRELKVDDYPILIGTSKKSFIGSKLGLDLKDRLEPTLATLYMAYMNGATWFRVHDVRSANIFLKMTALLEG